MGHRLYRWITIWCLCLIAPAVLAQAAETAAIPELPASLLVDQTGALSNAERAVLEDRLRAIQASGRAQVAILVSVGAAGEPLADFSLRVAEAWRLGRSGRNDGLLILLIPSTAAARIEVGYGLEGAIPDARASQWLDDLLPAMRQEKIAAGLNHLLDQVGGALPKAEAEAASSPGDTVLDVHPEWKLPFVLVVFSPFAIFPVLFGSLLPGRSRGPASRVGGGLASGLLLAAFFGGAAWALWDRTAALMVAGSALPLPLLWMLNAFEDNELAPWLRYARAFGNLIGVVFFFAVITLFVGVGLQVGQVEELWMAPIFAGLLAIGLAVFLFPGKAHYLMLVLRSAMHFALILAIVYPALQPFIPHPAGMAFAASGALTACIALSLYLDARERSRAQSRQGGGVRWSLWIVGLVLLVVLPFALMSLAFAFAGEDLKTQIIQAAAGGGSLTGIAWLAARVGLFAAVKVGLGGLFGGGGAGRGG